MARSQSRVEPQKEITYLTKRHKRLKQRVSEYEARIFLSTTEQVDLLKLKKEKLLTKDQIESLRSPAD